MISPIPSNFANAVAPYAPVARQPVSQESRDLKESSFRPAEQLSEAPVVENYRSPDERRNDDLEQERNTRNREQAYWREQEMTEREEAERIREEQIKEERIKEERAKQEAIEAQFAQEQRQLEQRRARAELFGEIGQRNIDINRRLIDIGVMPGAVAGRWVDRRV